MDSIEDDDQYMNESFIDEDSGELDDGGDLSDENVEEVIDYEEMKRDLELFQNADLVKEALEKDVDLVEYGRKIEDDLMAASKGSVADYIAESANLANLHKDIDLCDSILLQIQDLLHVYQKDLSGVANEIRSLQSESVILSQKLQNRREMDGVIRGFINKVAINPNMVKVLIEGDINDEYVATLHKFDAQLDFVDQDIEDEELHVRTGEVKAIKEVKSDLNILKAQCSSRLKDHIYSKIRLITPDCDLETIQKQELIEMAGIMAFLKKHIPKTFEDVKKQYLVAVKEIMMNRIKSYRELLLPHEMVVGSVEDPLVHTQSVVRSFLKKKSTKSLKEYTTEGFELGTRVEVLKSMQEEPMTVTPLQEGDDPDMDAVVSFRNQIRLFMDSASAEYQFLKGFFGVEDSSLFDEEFKDVCKYFSTQILDWASASVDIFGVLLVAMQIQSVMNALQNSEYPILIDFWLPLRDKVLARFGAILDKHITSVKTAQSQVKSLEITESLHYSVKRFTAVSTGGYYLGQMFSDLLLEKSKWKTPLDLLSTEVCVMIEKFSEQVNEEHTTLYLMNNACFILSSWKAQGITIDEENAVSKLFDERVTVYLEDTMSEHMTFLYEFVKRNEKKKGSQLKLSSNEMKGLKLYKENYKDGVAEMHQTIRSEMNWYGLEVYKAFVKMVTEYHTKYIQILGGTSFVKELVPVKHIVNEATKYSVEYE
ncbi:vacuolar protein sorting-associated protein [Blastocystis sp. subtype 4]|uniref:vacuolar protein sorting-associated protein n=1 Tax=Blastocystis sp. subtype 4 TaxID=944170 RepID=UPI0007120386|nr:vacuolar protein sorting-associated protein [Blastocystis sp. subtype 4]KNB42651.1 vacuolar protein sorting-associated protein [Blastocystis sp. subtype 4]|eukprot:XP_014526094.1 vacuolar protein sorting-associated protein [Blastocystis sp. subtype 4]